MELDIHQLDLRYQALRRRSAQRERAVLASLSEIGQQAPVVVLCTDGGRAVLLDGYKRVRALERLRRDTVRATAWSLPEEEALLLERLMRSSEAESALEQGWLLRELAGRFGLAPTEIAKRFDKSPSWVSRRLALVRELPEAIQEHVRLGELGAHAAMKHLVPLARANAAEAKQLAAALAPHRFSNREVATLCAAWQSGKDETRKLILEKPEVVLRARIQLLPPREPGPEERLLSDFHALGAIARRAQRGFRGAEIAAWPQPLRKDAQLAARSAQQDTEGLFLMIRKELLDAGPERPRRDSDAP